jgi:hypothetical protein
VAPWISGHGFLRWLIPRICFDAGRQRSGRFKKTTRALSDALCASAELSKPAPARPTSPRRSLPTFDEAAAVCAANRRKISPTCNLFAQP